MSAIAKDELELIEQAVKAGAVLIIGGRDMDAGAVSVRLHGKSPQGAKPKAKVVAGILDAIRKRLS